MVNSELSVLLHDLRMMSLHAKRQWIKISLCPLSEDKGYVPLFKAGNIKMITKFLTPWHDRFWSTGYWKRSRFGHHFPHKANIRSI